MSSVLSRFRGPPFDHLRRAYHSARQRARMALGDKRCPVCQRNTDAFAPIPEYFAINQRRYGFVAPSTQDETCNVAAYGCPHCGASDRERLYALWLATWLPRIDPAFTLIDFAPAPALRTHLRNRYRIRYRTADLFMEDVDDKVDLCSMFIYPDNSIDAFICSHILEHVVDDLRAMSELFRILRPGGQGITMVPIPLGTTEAREGLSYATEEDRWRHYGQGDHVRIYSRPVFIERLSRVGFVVTPWDARRFGRDTLNRHGISPTSVLYVVSKPHASAP